MLFEAFFLLILYAFICLYSGCSNGISGVETTNGVVTAVATSKSIEGTAPAFSQVFLFDTSYVPYIDSGIGIGSSADEGGGFRLITRPGSYNVLVIDSRFEQAAVVNAMVVSDIGGENDSVRLQEMNRTGSITGSVTAVTGGSILVYLAGMCYYRILPASGGFSFDGIPAGKYYLRIAFLNDDTSKRFEIKNETDVAVAPGRKSVIREITID